jgi:hypothetical protein
MSGLPLSENVRMATAWLDRGYFAALPFMMARASCR